MFAIKLLELPLLAENMLSFWQLLDPEVCFYGGTS